jgi:hypothetical protein
VPAIFWSGQISEWEAPAIPSDFRDKYWRPLTL